MYFMAKSNKRVRGILTSALRFQLHHQSRIFLMATLIHCLSAPYGFTSVSCSTALWGNGIVCFSCPFQSLVVFLFVVHNLVILSLLAVFRISDRQKHNTLCCLRCRSSRDKMRLSRFYHNRRKGAQIYFRISPAGAAGGGFGERCRVLVFQ